MLSRLTSEQFAFHDRVESLIRSKILVPANPPPIHVLFLKALGDTYAQLDPFLTATTREQRLRAAKESYEAALDLAGKSGLVPCSPYYLRTILNWSVFQRTRLLRSEAAIEPLFAAYSEAMRKLATMPDRERPEAAAVLELMRSNLTSWMADEEPSDPTPPARTRSKSKSKLITVGRSDGA
jgi:hypothetical protein